MKKTEIAEAVESLGNSPEGMSTEQAQEAAALAAMVAEAGEPVTVTGEPIEKEQEMPRMSAAESLGGLLSGLSGVMSYAGLKNTAAVWSPETCQECANRAVPVLKKYPWGARFVDFLETGAGVEEMALAMFLFPVGIATAQAWKADAATIAERKKKQDTDTDGGKADANQ